MGTLRHAVEKHGKNQQAANADAQSSSSSASSASSNNGSAAINANNVNYVPNNNNENTNSLQRQRLTAYRDFQSVLNEPRRNPKEFALSLAHLSQVSKLAASDDVFDEMHFQILATRRDVVNMCLRFVLIVAVTVLAYS